MDGLAVIAGPAVAIVHVNVVSAVAAPFASTAWTANVCDPALSPLYVAVPALQAA